MDKHAKYLSLCCRLCCARLTSMKKKPKTISLYSSIVKTVYKIDCAKDNDMIHPTLICDKCRRFLDRWKGVDSEKVPQRNAHSFLPHRDWDCVCVSSYSFKPKKQVSNVS